uniref:Uncharacterized protein n=1 Tax=Physcomitrium patens TaxID=3218 RepID=A0A2K1LAC7_PHYPA|nr:hypothetical protein PHYPA_001406 [Physcomitrium patens]
MDARAVAQRLNGVKILEDNKGKAAMLKTFTRKSRLWEIIWDEKLHEFHKGVVQHAATLKREQLSVIQAFRQRSTAKAPTKPQWSPALLKHRKVQTFLGKQGNYLEADEVKRIADSMELLELRATIAAYAAEVALKEQALRTKQQNEMEVLLQWAAEGRDELRKQRDTDHARCIEEWWESGYAFGHYEWYGLLDTTWKSVLMT